jgi:hypothetical protein
VQNISAWVNQNHSIKMMMLSQMSKVMVFFNHQKEATTTHKIA